MPPDPFSADQADWSPMAAGLHGFYAALLAAGFNEGPALRLVTQYLNTLLAVMMTQAQQQQPQDPEACD
jgi:uncharacterized protein YgfB (UPF0149 family)